MFVLPAAGCCYLPQDLMIQEARMQARDKLLLDASPQGLQGVERRAEGKEAAGGDVGGCTDWSAMQAQVRVVQV